MRRRPGLARNRNHWTRSTSPAPPEGEEFFRTPDPRAPIGLQRTDDGPLPSRGHVGADGTRRDVLVRHLVLLHLGDLVRWMLEGLPARRQFIEHSAKGIDVCPSVDRPGIRCLLGHVPRGTQFDSRLGDRQVDVRVAGDHLHESEVGDSRNVPGRSDLQQHIGRLEVAVDEAPRMGGRNACDEALRNPVHDLLVECHAIREELFECRAVDVLHHKARTGGQIGHVRHEDQLGCRTLACTIPSWRNRRRMNRLVITAA